MEAFALEAAAIAYFCAESAVGWTQASAQEQGRARQVVADLVAGRRVATCRRDRAVMSIWTCYLGHR